MLAVAAEEGSGGLGGDRLEFRLGDRRVAGLHGEAVERRGEDEPRELLGGDVGSVELQPPPRGEALEPDSCSDGWPPRRCGVGYGDRRAGRLPSAAWLVVGVRESLSRRRCQVGEQRQEQ